MGRNLKNPLPSDPKLRAEAARLRMREARAVKAMAHAKKKLAEATQTFDDIKLAFARAKGTTKPCAVIIGSVAVTVDPARGYDDKGRLRSFGEAPKLEWFLPPDYPACQLRPQIVRDRAKRRREWIERRMAIERGLVADMNHRYIRNHLKRELALLKKECLFVL